MFDSIYFEVGKSVQSIASSWYRNIQLLGPGGNAATFLVMATSGPYKGALFAMKVFRKLSDSKRRDRFLNEAAFLKTCSHPNIMRVYDEGVFKQSYQGNHFEYPFILADYLPTTLTEVIRRNDVSVVQRVSYVLQIFSALKYLSSLVPPVLHRDIKPDNIFVKGKTCLLGDFGLLKTLRDDAPDDKDAFIESLGGKIPFLYRSPDLVEYAKLGTRLTTKSDLFQFGLVVAELFTGWNPARKPKDYLDPVELDTLGHVSSSYGGSIVSLINRMLVMDPNQRESVEKLFDPWQGLFWQVVEQQTILEGRAL